MSATPARRARRKFRKQLSDKLDSVVVPWTPEGDAALSYIRQSHYTDESMSAVTQVQDNTRWCNAYDVPITETVQDLHVSGDLDPFKRAGLREWLSDAPPRPWKTLIVPKLDRLVRNVMDALNLLNWLRARGKRLISIAEGIDSSNSMSEFLITLIVAFARMERERMRERFRDAKARLKEAGRWGGEGHIYGSMPVQLPGGGWILGLDPYAVNILHQLSKLVRENRMGLTDLCEWLEENNVVTPRNRQLQLGAMRRGEDPASVELNEKTWQKTSVRRMLGDPELVDMGIFEPAEQAEILVVLEERSRKKKLGSDEVYPFSGVLVCAVCLEPLWHRLTHVEKTRKDGTTVVYDYNYWHCKDKSHGPSMRVEEVEPLAERSFYRLFSMIPVRERIVLPPTSHANEIAKLEREYGKMMAGVAREKSKDDRRRIMSDAEKILSDIDTLRSLPIDPGGVQWVPTDRTWREELEGLDSRARRQRWLDLGFSCAVKKQPDGSWVVRWVLPEGWREAMPEVAALYDEGAAGSEATDGVSVDITPLLDLPPAALPGLS